MSRSTKYQPAVVVAFIAILAGAILGFVLSYWFLLLVPVGAFLPGILRRLRLLRDADEFVLAAQNAAGWIAFCVSTSAAILFFVLKRTGVALGGTETDRLLVVAVLGFTAYASCYLFKFWDGRKAARYLLLVLGIAWGVFVVLSEWNNPGAMAMEGLVVVLPPFALVALGRFFPRVAGWVALSAAILAAVHFDAYDFSKGSGIFVFSALVLPLIVAGSGFLTRIKEESQ
jgi:hypothetical protein